MKAQFFHSFKKYYALLLISLLLLPVGCGKEKVPGGSDNASVTSADSATLQTSWEAPDPENTVMPSDPGDSFILIPDLDLNTVFVTDLTTFPGIPFEIVTTEKIETLSASKGSTALTSSILQFWENEEIFPYYVFQCYQKTDWNLMYNLYLKNQEQYPASFNPYFTYHSLFEDIYKKLDAAKIPKLYHYTAMVYISKLMGTGKNEEINEVTVTVNGVDHSLKLGKVVVVNETKNNIYSSENFNIDNTIIKPNAFGSISGHLKPCRDGLYTVDTVFDFICESDITITGFRLLDDNSGKIEIVEADVNSTGAAGAMNQVWSGEPMTFSKGTEIKIYLKIKDSDFAGKLMYFTNINSIVDYQSGSKPYSLTVSIGSYVGLNGYAIYAAEVDGVDMYSYYADFYTLTQR